MWRTREKTTGEEETRVVWKKRNEKRETRKEKTREKETRNYWTKK